MKVLVTGANGFLGRHVVAALHARGLDVRAMVRPAANIEKLGWPASIDVFRADLRTSTDLKAAFDGVDVVVHLAALIAGGEDAQFAGTVGATERLLDAMAGTACRRIVLSSSFSVYNYSAVKESLDESSPLHDVSQIYGRDGYSVAKWWQERLVRRVAEREGWELTVLRPGFIWGRDNGYLAALGQRIGRHHVVIGPRTRIPMTHVENCADVFAIAVTDPRARNQTFNIVDDPGERIWTYLGDHMRRTEQNGWRVPLPYRLFITGTRVAAKTIFRKATKVPGLLMPDRLDSRLKPLHFDNRKLRETLNWKPPLTYQQCLERTYGPQTPLIARTSERGPAKQDA